MFFFFSKVLHFLLTPVIWIFLLLLMGLWRRKSSWKRWVISALVVCYVFGNSFIVDEVFRWYEFPARKFTATEHYDYAIVLSGMTIWDAEFSRANFHGNIDRLLQTLPYFSAHSIDTLILSGGDGTAFQQEAKESEILIQYLSAIGMDTSRIIAEKNSRNTRENALFTKNTLDSLGINISKKKVLLVTSALHMRRSKACFDKVGIPCEVYVTNRTSGPRKFTPDHLLFPNASALHSWKALLHELIGFVTYKIMGYI